MVWPWERGRHWASPRKLPSVTLEILSQPLPGPLAGPGSSPQLCFSVPPPRRFCRPDQGGGCGEGQAWAGQGSLQKPGQEQPQEGRGQLLSAPPPLGACQAVLPMFQPVPGPGSPCLPHPVRGWEDEECGAAASPASHTGHSTCESSRGGPGLGGGCAVRRWQRPVGPRQAGGMNPGSPIDPTAKPPPPRL